MDWTQIEKWISEYEGKNFTIEHHQSIGGGCINEAYLIDGSNQQYFLKVNQSSKVAMFEAEKDGLQAMLDSASIKVPRPLLVQQDQQHSYLVMEYIALGGGGDAFLMGQQLAAMHQHQSDHFGWHRDNTIGSTPQLNNPRTDWIEFWREQRLGYQIKLAASRGIGQQGVKLCEQLAQRLESFFNDYQPQPSLLHGDLWSGNAAYTASGEPVIFDPACYYGDRETDLAMTELFGGFGAEFYRGYDAVWPLNEGYEIRKRLYNQYHILNHYNLFGGSYGSQAIRMTEQLLAAM